MDSQEAKEILRAHRPGTSDSDEPEIQEALDLARRDPGLSLWLEQQTAIHEVLRGCFADIPVPPGLAGQIIGANRRRKRIRWRQSRVLAAVAAAAVLAGAIAFWPGTPDEPDTFVAYRERMARAAQRDYRMGMLSRDTSEIRRYLRENKGHADFVLPPGLDRLPGIGAALLHWHDHPVSLVCLDDGNKGMLYVFITDQASFSNGPRIGGPEFGRLGRLTTASWTRDGKTYLLAATEDEETLRRRL